MATQQTIFAKALTYLARREYSELELKRRLEQTYPEQDTEIEQALLHLKKAAYLNNARFLESRIRHRVQQGYGQNKIVLELEQHGFRRSEILAQLSEMAERETPALHALILKKFSKVQDWNAEQKQKAIAYLLNRGFQFEEIRAALRHVGVQC